MNDFISFSSKICFPNEGIQFRLLGCSLFRCDVSHSNFIPYFFFVYIHHSGVFVFNMENHFAVHFRFGSAKRIPDQSHQKSLIYKVDGEDDLDDQIWKAGSKIVFIHFYATWCEPCKAIAPHLEKFAEKYASQIVMLKVDADEQIGLAMQFRLTKLPTFIFLKQGLRVQRFNSAEPNLIENAIKAWIK